MSQEESHCGIMALRGASRAGMLLSLVRPCEKALARCCTSQPGAVEQVDRSLIIPYSFLAALRDRGSLFTAPVLCTLPCLCAVAHITVSLTSHSVGLGFAGPSTLSCICLMVQLDP